MKGSLLLSVFPAGPMRFISNQLSPYPCILSVLLRSEFLLRHWASRDGEALCHTPWAALAFGDYCGYLAQVRVKVVPELQHRVGAQQSGGAQAALLCSVCSQPSLFLSLLPCAIAQLPAEDPVCSIIFSSRDLWNRVLHALLSLSFHAVSTCLSCLGLRCGVTATSLLERECD